VTAGQYVTVSVSDTGVGMPLDVIAKAFGAFLPNVERCASLLALRLPLSTMRVFAIGIKHPLAVAVQTLSHTDPRVHRELRPSAASRDRSRDVRDEPAVASDWYQNERHASSGLWNFR
jgi:hypothetical protein